MSAAVSANPQSGFSAPSNNYDQDVDDFLRDIPIDNTTTANNVTTAAAKDVDEEITVRKKRAPIPKLDENRLLSDAGIPKLRKIAKSQLKFKGKGHEFSDIGRLLNCYQLWLDDLYPRAKFRDAVGMVEKVGHGKRMQVMRRAWIDGTKPSRRQESVERVEHVEMSGGLGGNDDDDLFGEGFQVGAGSGQQPELSNGGGNGDVPNDDELDALVAENEQATSMAKQPVQQQRSRAVFEEEDEDELDALMAENEMTAAKPTETAPTGSAQAKKPGPFQEDGDEPDEDDLDALLAEEPESSHALRVPAATDGGKKRPDDDFADEEVMASMDW